MHDLKATYSAFQRLLKYTFLILTAMVMNGLELGRITGSNKITTFKLFIRLG
jgi:hypothetical protein